MSEPPYSGRERVSLASALDRAVGDVEDEGIVRTAFLVGLSGRYAGKLFRLQPGENLIGRSSAALVRLDEKATSHEHAKLLLNAGGCYILDLESTNGTFVNDVRIASTTALQAGDVVRCGTSNFGVLTDADDEEQHTRAMARLTGTPATGLTDPPVGLIRRRAAQQRETGLGQASGAIAVQGSSLVPGEGTEPTLLDTLDLLLDKVGLALRFIRGYWKVILACVLLFACMGAATVEISPPTSSASCEVLLRGEDPRRRRSSDRLIDYFDMAGRNWTSPSLVLQTMKDMQMTNLSPGAVGGMARSLYMTSSGLSTYELGFRHLDPRFAEQFLASHVKNFLETEIGKAIAVVKSEVDLLSEQYEVTQDRLRSLEARLASFKEKNLEGLPENVAGQYGARAAELSRKDALAAQLHRYTQELALARRTLSSGSFRATQQVNRVAPYESALVGIKQQLAALEAKGFASTHPQVLELQTQRSEMQRLIEETRSAPETASERLANVAYQEKVQEVGRLEVLVNSTQKELGMLDARLTKTERLAAELPQVEVEYSDLLRRLEGTKLEHQELRQKLKSKELQLEFERASVAARYEILRQPQASGVSKSSTAAKRAGMGAGGGLAMGLLLAAVHWLVAYSRTRSSALKSSGTSIVRSDS